MALTPPARTPRRTLVAILAVVCSITLVLVPVSHAQSPPTLDVRVLVIAADGNETELPAITATLDRIGIPYDTLLAATTDLTVSTLRTAPERGRYSSIIMTSGHLWYYDAGSGTWPSAFTGGEWSILRDYQSDFDVRSATLFTYPTGGPGAVPDYGLTSIGYQDTTTAGPLTAQLTAAGQAQFDYLATDSFEVAYAWAYLGEVIDDQATTPLLTGPGGHVLASITTYPDGRQNLASSFGLNDWGLHSKLWLYGIVDWVTRGVFLGARHAYFHAQIDDLFIPSDMWDIGALSDQTGLSRRINRADWRKVVAWQQSLNSRYDTTADIRLEWAFNGDGAVRLRRRGPRLRSNNLTTEVVANNDMFTFVNHTFTHLNMDDVTYQQAYDDIATNQLVEPLLNFSHYVPEALVNPDISGLENPDFHRALVDLGIRYIISDVSRAGGGNPSPNTGIQSPYEPDLLIVPRRANNLFYNLRSPAQWVSEYNCFYGPNATCAGGSLSFWSQDRTYEQILQAEADQIVTYLLDWDVDPLMFHQLNLDAYSGNRSLFTDLIDLVFEKYNSYVTLPVRDLTHTEIGEFMLERAAYDSSGVTATMQPCTSLTLLAPVDVRVPVTGVSHGPDTEVYAGDTISYVALTAGNPVTIPLSCP